MFIGACILQALAMLTYSVLPVTAYSAEGSVFGPARNYSSLAPRAITEVHCTGVELSMVQQALKDAPLMTGAALSALEQLYTYVSQDPVPIILTQTPALRTMFRTYEAFFGQLYFGGDSVLVQGQNQVALERLKTFGNNVQKLNSALENLANIDLEIYCGDTWLSTVDDLGDQNTDADTLRYFDNRPRGSQRWIDFTASGGSCRDSSGILGYVYDWAKTASNTNTIMTLCQYWFDTWLSIYNAGQTMSAIQPNVYPTGSMSLGTFKSQLAYNLVHELSHSTNIMGATGNLHDVNCEWFTTKIAYDFDCQVKLGQRNPDYAIWNADSMAFFSVAMYMNNNDWHRGYSIPVGSGLA